MIIKKFDTCLPVLFFIYDATDRLYATDRPCGRDVCLLDPQIFGVGRLMRNQVRCHTDSDVFAYPVVFVCLVSASIRVNTF